QILTDAGSAGRGRTGARPGIPKRVNTLRTAEALIAVAGFASIYTHLETVIAHDLHYVAENLKDVEWPVGVRVAGDLREVGEAEQGQHQLRRRRRNISRKAEVGAVDAVAEAHRRFTETAEVQPDIRHCSGVEGMDVVQRAAPVDAKQISSARV